jgi:acetylornithine deacetylase
MDVPALTADAGFPGTEAPRTEAWGLVGTTASTGSDGPALILQGHIDVGPPGDLAKWAGDPFDPRVEGDVIHGRGACDMKAGVIANLMAIRALRAADVRLAGQVALHSVVSEEDGGLGAFGTLARGHRGDACVITEPTSGNAMTANAGALTFTLRVPGRATHGSTRYMGVSAIDAFLPVYRALAELEAQRNSSVDPMMTDYEIPYPIAVGVVRSGDWASTVPDLLIAEGRYGVAIGEQVAEARAMFEQHIREVCAADPWLSDNPVTVEWTGGQFASGRMPDGDPLLPLTQAAWADVTGGESRQVGAPYGSDLRLYTGEGIPTLQFGPGAAYHAHSPIEQVRVDEIERVAQALVLMVLRSVGTR